MAHLRAGRARSAKNLEADADHARRNLRLAGVRSSRARQADRKALSYVGGRNGSLLRAARDLDDHARGPRRCAAGHREAQRPDRLSDVPGREGMRPAARRTIPDRGARRGTERRRHDAARVQRGQELQASRRRRGGKRDIGRRRFWRCNARPGTYSSRGATPGRSAIVVDDGLRLFGRADSEFDALRAAGHWVEDHQLRRTKRPGSKARSVVKRLVFTRHLGGFHGVGHVARRVSLLSSEAIWLGPAVRLRRLQYHAHGDRVRDGAELSGRVGDSHPRLCRQQ